MKVVGFDIGGTKIECVLFDVIENATGTINLRSKTGLNYGVEILCRKRTPTERVQGYEAVLEKIKTLCLETCHEAGVKAENIEKIGFGLPGSVDPATQMMINGNTQLFIGKDLAKDVCRELKIEVPVSVENDANCFALAEALCGAGQDHAKKVGKNSNELIGIGIILGTGVGGGVIFQGNILKGKHGGGGELGHFVLRSNGHPCYCGQEGCVEQYLSGPALEALFASRIYQRLERPKAEEIFELAQKEEPLAKAVVKNYQRYLTKFLVNISNIFDPDFFVLGGGVSSQTSLYLGLEENVSRETFIPNSTPCIYQHKLGDSAGVIGAALLTL